jgi:hypothetical protein
MPGWDVKIRPGKDEKKKDDDYSWVIFVVLGLLLLLWLYGGHGSLPRCGMYQDGVHCDRGWAPGGGHDAYSSGHHRPHRVDAGTEGSGQP